jgi:hypothetical protein
MLEKHFTKGSWKLTRSKKGHKMRVSGDDWGEFASAYVRMSDEKNDSKEGLANAKLIAAAPELLKACEKALEVLTQENIFGETRLLLFSAIKNALSEYSE